MAEKEVQKQWIEAVKSVGQSLIDNAEEIAGHCDFQTGVFIMASLRPDDVVGIDISTTYLPEKIGTKQACSLIEDHPFISTDGEE